MNPQNPNKPALITKDAANIERAPAPPATFSPDRKYRYILTRRCGFGERTVLFVMLNPSKADELRDDNTVSKVIRISNRHGYGWLIVANLSPLRSTDRRVMLAAGREPKPVRESNLTAIREAAAAADTVVIAWGADGGAEGRDTRALGALKEIVQDIHCLGLTKDGHPRHPLYLRETTRIRPYMGPPC